MDTRILSLHPLSSVTIFFFVFSNLKIFHLKNQRKENHLWSSDFKLLRGNKSCKKIIIIKDILVLLYTIQP